MKNGLYWGNSFAIGDADTKKCPFKMPYFPDYIMRKASLLLPSGQTSLSNGSSCIQEFLFEVRFYFLSKKGH